MDERVAQVAAPQLRADQRPVRGTALAACLSFIAFAMASVTFNPVWPADSVEFCPHPDAFNLFVCGTYNLEKNEEDTAESPAADEESGESAPVQRGPQVRRGQCMLFSVEAEHNLCVPMSNSSGRWLTEC